MTTGNNVYSVWSDLLAEIYFYGKPVAPRDKPIKEVMYKQIVIEDALANIITSPLRKINYRFMVGQWLTTLLGREDKLLEKFNSRLSNYETDGRGGTYPSYGLKLKPQWQFIFQCFANDPMTRQAVMSIWEPQDVNASVRLVPCTLSIQFMLRQWGGQDTNIYKLHTFVSMRSSDAWLGLPYDIYNFSMLANYLSTVLRKSFHIKNIPGYLVMNLGSSHLYAEHLEKAKEVIDGLKETAGFARSVHISEVNIPPQTQMIFEKQELSGTGWDRYTNALYAENNAKALEELIR